MHMVNSTNQSRILQLVSLRLQLICRVVRRLFLQQGQ